MHRPTGRAFQAIERQSAGSPPLTHLHSAQHASLSDASCVFLETYTEPRQVTWTPKFRQYRRVLIQVLQRLCDLKMC